MEKERHKSFRQGGTGRLAAIKGMEKDRHKSSRQGGTGRLAPTGANRG